MKLMIDIPEEVLEAIAFKNKNKLKLNPSEIAILHGIPLPKGHGRLIDADAYKSEINRIFPCQSTDDKNIRRATEIGIDNAPTIVEADGGE